MPDGPALIPVFVPPLANVLAFAEKVKGSPLTAAEVEGVRDKSACIMMEMVTAEKMHEARGFVDVNPDNVWADWHRLRPQMAGGYLPKIILCIPGDDALRANCEPILRAEHIEHEFRPHEDTMLLDFKRSSMTEPAFTSADFERIAAHTTVLYALSKSIKPGEALGVSREFLGLGCRLLDAGGIAIKCDSSGIADPAARWSELHQLAEQSTAVRWPALFKAYVFSMIGSPTDLYTCGLHLLGMPDLIISKAAVDPSPQTSPEGLSAIGHLFRVFASYLLGECPVGKFASGNTFSLDANSPRYRVTWESCTGYAEDDYFYNSFGRWRFAKV